MPIINKVIITGVAGFIGSHLAERLVKEGYYVVGIDSFTDYYPRTIKMQNLGKLKGKENFHFNEIDLFESNLDSIQIEDDIPIIVFHLAGQPGVRGTLPTQIDAYIRNNLYGTLRLLEWSRKKNINKFIFSSSSSVYGNCNHFPVKENNLLNPISYYAWTKLAAEKICIFYLHHYNVPTVILRYFSVYGPRQRPDMAFSRFILALLKKRELLIYGNGSQTRDFTFVDDVVNGTILSTRAPAGEIINICSGTNITLSDAGARIEKIVGIKQNRRFEKKLSCDVNHTFGDFSRAKNLIGYSPKISLNEGLERQIDWVLSNWHNLIITEG